MIQALKIERFGKFHNKQFELSRLTIFSGPNEAGKTTIFDAIFDALCSPKGTTEQGRRLNNRYGTMRSAVLQWNSEPYQMNEADFIDLCSISALRKPPGFSSTGSWMNSIKNQLFTGGVNPGIVLERLKHAASTKGSLKHNKELKRLQELEQAQMERMRSLEQQRSTSLQELTSAQHAAEQIAELESQLSELENKQGELQRTAHQYEAIQKLHQLRSQFSQTVSYAELKRSVESERWPDPTEIARLKEQAAAIQDSEQQQHTVASLLNEATQERTRITEMLQELEAEKIRSGRRASEAESLLHDIRTQRSGSPTAAGLLAAGILGAAAAAAGLIWGSNPLFPLFTTIAGISTAAAITGLILMLRQRRSRYSQQRILNSAQAALDIANCTTLQELEKELQKVSLTPVQLKTRIESVQQQQSELDSRCQEREQHLQHIAADLQQKQTKLDLALDNYGCRNIAELERTIENYQHDQSRLATMEAALKPITQHTGIADISVLQAELGRRIESVENTITIDEPTEAQYRNLEKESQTTADNLEAVRNKLNTLHIRHTRQHERYDTRFSELPQEILRVEQEIQQTQRQQQEIIFTRQAAQAAVEILQELHEDTSEQLQELSSRVSHWFGDVLKNPRSISFDGFGDDQVRIEDAGGTPRRADQLSSGTKDAFYLAARLALIAESTLPQGVVMLDDPCLSLDPQRTRQAMSILLRFLQNTNHQIVYFSKDPEIPRVLQDALSAAGEADETIKLHML